MTLERFKPQKVLFYFMNFTTKPSYYQVGGSLTNNAPNYVKRQADDDLYNGLKAGEFCYVLNTRQMGKSSLQVRTIQRLRNEGIACAAIDISEIGNRGVTPEQWYAGLLRILENNFNLSDIVNVRTWWRDRNFLTPVQRLSEFIETVLLPNISSNIVIFIDEIDSILALDFPADDFLALIRSCYNKRANNSEFDRLTWALLGVASPTDLCREQNASSNTPFNIGKAIELTGFDETEAQPLAAGLAELTDRSQEVLTEVLYWTGGQPFLTQKLCKLLLENPQLMPNLPPPAPPCQGGEKDVLSKAEKDLRRAIHTAIKAVSEDLEGDYQFNTAVSEMMKLSNALNDAKCKNSPIYAEGINTLIRLLAPFAPHIADELWHNTGNSESVHRQTWPTVDASALITDEITLVIQVMGKTRGTIQVPSGADKAALENFARESELAKRHLEGKEIKKVIVVPGKLVNFVVA